jgi:hypothetical protein
MEGKAQTTDIGQAMNSCRLPAFLGELDVSIDSYQLVFVVYGPLYKETTRIPLQLVEIPENYWSLDFTCRRPQCISVEHVAPGLFPGTFITTLRQTQSTFSFPWCERQTLDQVRQQLWELQDAAPQ